ncbi:MAG: hypothetical protein KDB80_16090 [Planctomycetes bacterium]|nr:hypothetical protein [Planctomycetota bacterium]
MVTEPRYRSLDAFRRLVDLPRPTDWSVEFGRTAPVHVEIGVGNGDWIARQVVDRPDENHVGVELEWGRVMKTLRKLSRVDGALARVVCGDARVFLHRCCAPRSLTGMTCLFPEPWPRDRHEKNRLFSTAMLDVCANRLVDGGAIRIVTDAHPYADWIESQNSAAFQLERRRIEARHDTWFERIWSSKGQTDFSELILTKRSHPDLPLVEDITLRTHVCERFDPKTFRPADLKADDISVVFKDRLDDPDRGVVMLRATVAEPDLVQHLWVEVRRGDRGWQIRPAGGCSFVPTAGVQVLLDAVFDAATREVD